MEKIKKYVGKVTEIERDEIKLLFERKNGLAELFKILEPNNEILYEKMIKDMSETSLKFQKWWDRMCEKYKWESDKNGHWEIDFNNCEINLIIGGNK